MSRYDAKGKTSMRKKARREPTADHGGRFVYGTRYAFSVKRIDGRILTDCASVVMSRKDTRIERTETLYAIELPKRKRHFLAFVARLPVRYAMARIADHDGKLLVAEQELAACKRVYPSLSYTVCGLGDLIALGKH